MVSFFLNVLIINNTIKNYLIEWHESTYKSDYVLLTTTHIFEALPKYSNNKAIPFGIK